MLNISEIQIAQAFLQSHYDNPRFWVSATLGSLYHVYELSQFEVF